MKLPLVVKQATRSMFTVYDADGHPIATTLPKDIADKIALSVNVFDDLTSAAATFYCMAGSIDFDMDEKKEAEVMYQKVSDQIEAVKQSG